MDYYALINEENKVVQVITGRNHQELTEEITSWEDYYSRLHNLKCKRTCFYTSGNVYIDPKNQKSSKEKAFRKNSAGIGYTYDEARDAFIAPKPFSKWILNEDTCLWEAPVPYPQDDKFYVWNDNKGEWEEVVE